MRPPTSRDLAALLPVLAALSAPGCAEPTPSDAAEPPPAASGEPAREEPPEYVVLAAASVFEGCAVGAAGTTPISAIAFARLVLRDDAGALFDLLLESDRWVPRLYGLFGLWFTDRARYLRVSRDLAKSDARVPHQYGCIVGELSVQDLLRSMDGGGSASHRSSPVDLFTSGLAWLREVDPGGQDLDYWRSVVLDEERPEKDRLQAARVLAISLGRNGLDAVFGLMPVLAADLRADVADLRAVIAQALQGIPPWADGTLEVVSEALEGDDRSVHVAALNALQSLLLSPRSRAACRALVPRLEILLASYRRPGGGLPTQADEDWIGELASALRNIGGPGGPVLARALGHSEPFVRNMVSYPEPWNLGSWTGETVGELARQLEHPDAGVRARVLRGICCLLDPEPSPPPEEVIVEVEKHLPAIRRATLTLEGEERVELRERIDQLLRRGPAERSRLRGN